MRWNDWMRSLSLAGAAALVFAISGCNTVEGIGEDVESAGDAVEDEASERD